MRLPGSEPARHPSLEIGFLYVGIEGDTLTLQLIGTDGVVDSTKTIQKWHARGALPPIAARLTSSGATRPTRSSGR